MPKYLVSYDYTIVEPGSDEMVVEAFDEDEAVDIAAEQANEEDFYAYMVELLDDEDEDE